MTMKKKFFLMLLASALFLTSCSPAAAQSGVSALFINIGNGDSALFFLGDDRYLIDTGTKDMHEQLVRVLSAYNIRHLDGIFVTHTDKDHSGGLKKLFKSGVTADVLYAGTLHSETSLEDHRVWEAADKYNVPLKWLSAGDSVTASDGSVFHVLGPLKKDPSKENNNSLVMRLETKEGSMLLTGDMEFPEEADLLQAGVIAPADVMKIANHGESDATSLALMMQVSPQWSVISTSTAEEPDTPHKGVLARIAQSGSAVAVTQEAEVGILITLSQGKVHAEKVDWQ